MSEEIIKVNSEDMEIILPDGIDRTKRNKGIPIETIIEYRKRGLSINEIAKLCGCSKQNVHERLETVGYDDKDMENFRRHRAEVFSFIQSKLLNSLDLETIKDMNPYQRIISASILFDKERLETGKSTENIDVHQIYKDIKKREERLRELRKIVGETKEDKK